MLYGEDVYVGYRFYEKTKKAALFPFGHGLSYTAFSRSNLSVESSPEDAARLTSAETVTISVAVKNVGHVGGAETVQVWIVPPPSPVNRPVRELKGFKKVYLQPGEERVVKIVIEKKVATSWWDEQRDAWVSQNGQYGVEVTGTGPDALHGQFQVGKTRYWVGL